MSKPKAIPDELFCKYCGRKKDTKKDFYKHLNKYHQEGRFHYCKDCCKEIALSMRKDNENFELFCREMCTFFDMPYIDAAMALLQDRESNAHKDGKDMHFVSQYLTCLNEVKCPPEYWNNLSGNSFLGLDLLKVAVPTSEGDNELFIELEKKWGKQSKLKDYVTLEKSYEKYSEGEDIDPAMDTTLRYLCLAELEVARLKAKGEDSNNEEKKVMSYFKTLKLDNFTMNKSKSIGEKMLEKWIDIEENTNPIEVFDETFADDMCNIGSDFDDIMRALKNLVTGSKEYPELS